MNVTYRRATAADVDTLAEYRLRFLAESAGSARPPAEEALTTHLRAYFREAIPRGTFIAWLAEQEGEVVATSGMVVWQIPANNSVITGKMAYVLNMYTVPEARRQGICAALLEKMIEEAKALALSRVHLHATRAGEGIYRRRGFAEPSDVELVLRLD